jgi:hypothetical protein
MEKLHIVIVDGMKVWVKGIISEANVTIAKCVKTGRFVSVKLAKAALSNVYAVWNSTTLLQAFREANRLWVEKLQSSLVYFATLANACAKHGLMKSHKAYDTYAQRVCTELSYMGWALV